MNTTAHTPGPWVATANGIHKGSECVALTHMEPREQRHADARLIAAAPELLEALIEARDQLEAAEFIISGESYNSPQINAAIAKATGASHES